MLRTAYRILLYYGTLACFGVFALAFNVRCALSRTGNERRLQRSIHLVFHRLVRWLAWVRLLVIEYRGLERLPVGGCVVVANHPGLLDAMFLLARVPAAICVFKPLVRRNPLFGPAAIRAGYLPSDRRLALVRSAAARIAGGATLLVFPEGTRTPAGRPVGPFKPGFALIARRARAPVQLVRIRVDGTLLTKERAWWKLPQLPARVVIEAGPRLDPEDYGSTAELVAEAEDWFRAAGPGCSPPAFEAFPRRSTSLTLTAS